MQAINRLLSQNCNCYPHLFRCSTIKIHNSFQLPLKPSVALLSSHFNTLFSFQGANSGFEARSQNPVPWVLRSNRKLDLVGPSGLEPPTLRLSVVRSSQLSYGPVVGADSVSFATTQAFLLIHFIAPPLQITNASLVCDLTFEGAWWR